MGAAFLWKEKLLSFQSVFFFSRFSSERLLSLPPWSVSVLQNFFLGVKLSRVVSIAQLIECFLSGGTKRERIWALQQETRNQMFE